MIDEGIGESVNHFVDGQLISMILLASSEASARAGIREFGDALRASADQMDGRLKHGAFDLCGRQPAFVTARKFDGRWRRHWRS